MSNQRTVRYESHIRPMFRRKDRDSMLWAFDLWDYDVVVQHANVILNRLEVDMPPDSHGGLWPHEWVNLFRRWIDEGFGRLDPGVAAYTAQMDGSDCVVTATGDFPTDMHHAWLQRREHIVGGPALELDFYFEPRAGGSAPGFPFQVVERIPIGFSVEQLAVHDANGINLVSVVIN